MNLENILPKLIRAAFENDYKTIELIAQTLRRKFKLSSPKLSEEIENILSYRDIGSSTYRSIGINPLPKDKDTSFPLAKLSEPLKIEAPFLDENNFSELKLFILERKNKQEFIKYGLTPPNSIILSGKPGVGKTYTAKWLSHELDMPLITLDLSSVISSYLGKTGQNIKNLLEYAKSFNSILFLDEFDAIAKKREDNSDIGELKRIVNVLLKELEEWPSNCIVIAATNHPEIIDKAIWRRFDHHIILDTPNKKLRENIIKNEFKNFEGLDDKGIDIIADLTEGVSPADLIKSCNSVKRNYILSKEKIKILWLKELKKYTSKYKSKKDLCIYLKKNFPKLTIKEISLITNYSTSSVQRYLKES